MVHTNYIVNPRLAVFLSTLFWGTYWIPVRQIEILSGSPYFSSIGFFIAGGISICFSLSTKGFVRALDLRNVLGCICVAAAISLYTQGILYTSIANAVLLFYLSPVWGIFIGRFFAQIKFTVDRMSAIVFGLTGLVLVLGFGNLDMDGMTGNVMCILSGFLFAIAVTFFNNGRAIGTWYKLVFIGPTCGAFILLSSFGSGESVGITLDNFSWSSGLWIILFSTVWVTLPLWLIIYAVHALDAVKMGLGMMFEIVVSLVSAAILTQEQITLRQILGTILIIGASLVDVFGLRFWNFNKHPKN